MICRLSLRKLRAGAGFAIICAKANGFSIRVRLYTFLYYDGITKLQILLASREIVQHLKQSSSEIGPTMVRVSNARLRFVCGVTILEKEMVYSNPTSRDSFDPYQCPYGMISLPLQ
jgi:hypothetical protein